MDTSIKSGDYCKRTRYGFIIYSEILDAADFILGGRKVSELDEEELMEYEETKASYLEPHMELYRFTRSYSTLCPYGELGDVHLSVVTKISPEEFLAAKSRGWR